MSGSLRRGLRQRGWRAAFTLVEALLGVTVTSVAGTAVLLGLSSSLDSADASLSQLTATGLAQLYLDELSGLMYAEPGNGPQGGMGPGSPEQAGLGRTLYDDMDDYHGLSNQPPRDTWNVNYGEDNGAGGQRHPNFRLPTGALANYRVACEIYYVSSSNLTTRLTGSSRSNYRAIHVRVFVSESGRGERQLVDLRRVVGYVPSL